MNQLQFQILGKVESIPVVIGLDDIDKTPRTLLYGYTCDRNTWHVYVYGDHINRFVYQFNGETILHNAEHFWVPRLLIPDKRLYPQYCDFLFCEKLKALGVSLPFTNYTEPTQKGPFFGKLFQGTIES